MFAYSLENVPFHVLAWRSNGYFRAAVC